MRLVEFDRSKDEIRRGTGFGEVRPFLEQIEPSGPYSEERSDSRSESGTAVSATGCRDLEPLSRYSRSLVPSHWRSRSRSSAPGSGP